MAIQIDKTLKEYVKKSNKATNSEISVKSAEFKKVDTLKS